MVADAMPSGSPRWPALVLLLAVGLVYANSLTSPFLFDDAGAVVNNPTLRRLASLDVLRPPADGSTTTGRPVVNLSFALNRAITGEGPLGFRAGNVLLHGLATLTLFGLVRRTLRRCARPGGRSPTETAPAFLAALLWAVHPLQTESVVCVAQRTEVLCGLFYLLTLYAFARGTEPKGGANKDRRARWLAVSLGACLLGMGTKEVMVTAPVLVLLYDRTFGAGGLGAALRQRPAYYTALAATWLLLIGLLLGGGGSRGASAGFGLGVTAWTYLLKQAEAIVLYLKLSVWPHPLVLDYGTAVAASVGEVAGAAAVVVTLLAATSWALVRRPVAGFFGAWCFVILAPSSSVVPLVTQTVAEHRMYLPLAAVAVGAGLLVTGKRVRQTAWILGVAAVGLGAATVVRNRDYQSAVAIWSDTVAKAPQNARAHNNLALAWQEAGDFARAGASYTRAIELAPGYVSARYNWGVALLEQGTVAEAIAQLDAAVKLAPDHADARVNLGAALVRAGRAHDALPHFAVAARLRPAGDVHYNEGIALLELGRRSEAAVQFERALALTPQLADAQAQLGRLAELDGRMAEAETRYHAVLRLAQDHPLAHARLGMLLARTERFDAAAMHFRALTRLQPGNADAHANLGNTLLGLGRAREAIASYEQALRLRPDDRRTRENLALAHEALR